MRDLTNGAHTGPCKLGIAATCTALLTEQCHQPPMIIPAAAVTFLSTGFFPHSFASTPASSKSFCSSLDLYAAIVSATHDTAVPHQHVLHPGGYCRCILILSLRSKHTVSAIDGTSLRDCKRMQKVCVSPQPLPRPGHKCCNRTELTASGADRDIVNFRVHRHVLPQNYPDACEYTRVNITGMDAATSGISHSLRQGHTIASSKELGSHKNLRHCSPAGHIHKRILYIISVRCKTTLDHHSRPHMYACPVCWILWLRTLPYTNPVQARNEA